MKFIFLASLLTVQSLVSGQTTVTIPDSPHVQTLNCPEDKIIFGETVSGSIYQVCSSEGIPSNIGLLSEKTPGVRRILVSGNAIFAQSDNQMFVFGQSGEPLLAEPALIFGPGFAYNANPTDMSVEIQLPEIGRRVKMYLRGFPYDKLQPFGDFRDQCFPTILHYCQDLVGSIWTAGTTGFGFTNWKAPVRLFGDQRPVNMATDGTNLFVTLQTGAPGETSGSLVVRHSDGSVQVLQQNLDLPNDQNQDGLVVSRNGVYFISTYHQKNVQPYQVIWFLSFSNRRLSQIVAGNIGESFSGLAVVSAR